MFDRNSPDFKPDKEVSRIIEEVSVQETKQTLSCFDIILCSTANLTNAAGADLPPAVPVFPAPAPVWSLNTWIYLVLNSEASGKHWSKYLPLFNKFICCHKFMGRIFRLEQPNILRTSYKLSKASSSRLTVEWWSIFHHPKVKSDWFYFQHLKILPLDLQVRNFSPASDSFGIIIKTIKTTLQDYSMLCHAYKITLQRELLGSAGSHITGSQRKMRHTRSWSWIHDLSMLLHTGSHFTNRFTKWSYSEITLDTVISLL